MKTKTARLIALVLTSMATLSLTMLPAVSAKPATWAVNYNQAQFQWRGLSFGGPFGDWTSTYQNYATDAEFTLTGNVLHTAWTYSPAVTDQKGGSTVYVYDKKLDLWVENEGHVGYKYAPYYGDYAVVNCFRGYVKFDGAPSPDSFVHGVAYQWVYIFAPENEDVTSIVPYAHWDERINAWLVGFSVYLWDKAPQSYIIDFPDPFIEPVPASNYNPLGL